MCRSRSCCRDCGHWMDGGGGGDDKGVRTRSYGFGVLVVVVDGPVERCELNFN